MAPSYPESRQYQQVHAEIALRRQCVASRSTDGRRIGPEQVLADAQSPEVEKLSTRFRMQGSCVANPNVKGNLRGQEPKLESHLALRNLQFQSLAHFVHFANRSHDYL